ncbi:htrA protein [Polaribacter irgensii 23-P]|uniref:HtrA protein n=1 Tax=Polaribacter irgensii 23-P TaxID=313594 RepID=A4C2N0_9FLAO|nr:trypsin-like peptidase domain-containing protein [Polaribacter irgensii]EAR11554.1 htrA protein [Polaribacter irgensii 23-P]
MKKIISFLGMAILGGMITLGGYKLLFDAPVIMERMISSPIRPLETIFSATDKTLNAAEMTTDFTVAAEKTIHAVVHVKNTAIRTQTNKMDLFFGRSNDRKYEQVGTGSGVIISADGYVVTNNHVIDGATELEITLNNKKKYQAELIGRDVANDIALLKIKADTKLDYIPFANSDGIKIGEWVLAVGNPYNLTSTVTAGIVSAKGRDLEGNRNIESFIQTDAAVNPGNSGGALVNARGELIGINTAISSETGSFIGYSFAVPSNIAKKIINDILEFGRVQEAILGILVDPSYQDEGVKVADILEKKGGLKGAGLKSGDVITKIDEVKISKFSELKGHLTAKRPGEFVKVTIERGSKVLVKTIKLTEKIAPILASSLGWELKDLSANELKDSDIKAGVMIVRDSKYGLESYIITKINDNEVKDARETAKLLNELYTSRYANNIIELLSVSGERERIRF